MERKLNKHLAVTSRLKHYLPGNTILLIYNSLIISHFIYNISLCGQKSSYITKLQKKAMSNISKSKYNAHTDPIYKEFNILKFIHIVKLHDWKFDYKMIIQNLPIYFQKLTFDPDMSL